MTASLAWALGLTLAGFAWARYLSPKLFSWIAQWGSDSEPRATLTALAVIVACLMTPVLFVAAGAWMVLS